MGSVIDIQPPRPDVATVATDDRPRVSRRLRVAMIIHGYYPRVGGAEQQLAALAPVLQSHGVDVHVLTRRSRGLRPFEIIQGIPVHRLPCPRPKPAASLAFTIAAQSLLLRLRPDVIHAHELFSPSTTALFGKRLIDVPVVATAHRGGYLGDVQRLGRKLFGERRLRTIRDGVDAFVSISQEIDQELQHIGVPADRRIFIANGVDTDRFTPLSATERLKRRAELDLPSGPVGIFAGRLAPEKRVDHLLALWPAVRERHPDATLLVLGTGESERALMQSSPEGVRFLGAVEDVAPYLQCADLFVLPSIAEGLSVAVLEALSSEVAVLATAVGGTPEVIEHGANGWLVQPDDVDALRVGVLSLFADDRLRMSIARAGRQRAVQHYSVNATGSRLCELYGRLTEAHAMVRARC